MKRFQHIVGHLTLNDSDAEVLAWISNVASLASSTRITLVHAWLPIEIPAAVRERYPWLVEPGAKVAEQRARELVETHLQTPDSVEVSFEVRQGNALGELLEVIERDGADLVVAGRDEANIYLVEKLARKAPCSVLAVPAGVGTGFRKVLAAVDYSAFSLQALDVGHAFAQAGQAGLTLFHAFSLPWGHQRATVPKDRLLTDLENHHREQLERLVRSINLTGVMPELHLRESALPAFAIADAVRQGAHDLVVIGCRGRDSVYATLLGSTAEEILRTCPVPVVAVKAKGSGKAFLETLRRG
ncbi:MAG: hypothetical protein D6781_11895 [Verrucomicrobia bacterium]|nr:MAG: hypothetical protein D6781_11895 [Verrucomicrobiota bacterium]